MRHRTLAQIWISICSLFFLCGISGEVNSTNSKIANDFKWGGWITYWDFENGINTFNQNPTIFQDALFFSAHLNRKGLPVISNTRHGYIEAVRKLKAQGLDTWMTVVNDIEDASRKITILKDPDTIHKILTNVSLQREHRNQLVRLAHDYEFDGIDIDYENLLLKDRNSFSRFIGELSHDLSNENLLLSVTVQPKISDPVNSTTGKPDWKQICEHSHRLQIMLYNLHNQKTRPGPMATPKWITKVLTFAKTQCSIEKIVPVIKVSGMQWGPSNTKAMQFDQIDSLIKRHDIKIERETESGVPFFSFSENGNAYKVYYEDAHSLSIKLQGIRSMGFKSVVFWSLGRQDPGLVEQLRKE